MEKQIIASFDSGKLITGKRERISRVCFRVLIVCQLLMLTLLIIIIATGNFIGEDNPGYVLLGGNLFFLVILGLVFADRTINKRHKDKVKLWLEDSIELKAKIIRLDIPNTSSSQSEQGFKPIVNLVEARFTYNGENLVRRNKPRPFNIFAPTHKVFEKYHNKDVRILYSPKYDQVLLLKQ